MNETELKERAEGLQKRIEAVIADIKTKEDLFSVDGLLKDKKAQVEKMLGEFNQLTDAIDNKAETGQVYLDTVIEGIGNMDERLSDKGNEIQDQVNELLAPFSQLSEVLNGSLETTASALQETLHQAVEKTQENINEDIEVIKSFFTDEFVPQLNAVLEQLMVEVQQAIVALEDLIGQVSVLFNQFSDQILETAFQEVNQLFDGIFSRLKAVSTKFEDLGDSISTMMSSLTAMKDVMNMGVKSSGAGMQLAMEAIEEVREAIRSQLPMLSI